MKNLESKLQQECVKWFRYVYPKELLFAIPNGGHRNVITASILKAEGVLSGVFDLMLLSEGKRRIRYFRLFIEMKYGNNTLTDNQKEFKRQAELKGYKCEVCYSFYQFQQIITDYLD